MFYKITISVFTVLYFLATWTTSWPFGTLATLFPNFASWMRKLNLYQVWSNFPDPGLSFANLFVVTEFSDGRRFRRPFYRWQIESGLATGLRWHKFMKFRIILLSKDHPWIHQAFAAHIRASLNPSDAAALQKIVLEAESVIFASIKGGEIRKNHWIVWQWQNQTAKNTSPQSN